jgi:hypothetical protein
MTRIAPLPSSAPPSKEKPEKKKGKAKLKRQGASKNLKKADGNKRKVHPKDVYVGRANNPAMAKLQKDSALKQKVTGKFKEAGKAYKSRLENAADKFKSLVGTK